MLPSTWAGEVPGHCPRLPPLPPCPAVPAAPTPGTGMAKPLLSPSKHRATARLCPFLPNPPVPVSPALGTNPRPRVRCEGGTHQKSPRHRLPHIPCTPRNPSEQGGTPAQWGDPAEPRPRPGGTLGFRCFGQVSEVSADALRDARGLSHGSRLSALICSPGTHSNCPRRIGGAPGHPRPWRGLQGGSWRIFGFWCCSHPGTALSLFPLCGPGMLLAGLSSSLGSWGSAGRKSRGSDVPKTPRLAMEPLSPPNLAAEPGQGSCCPFLSGDNAPGHLARTSELGWADPSPWKRTFPRETLPTHPHTAGAPGIWEPGLC